MKKIRTILLAICLTFITTIFFSQNIINSASVVCNMCGSTDVTEIKSAPPTCYSTGTAYYQCNSLSHPAPYIFTIELPIVAHNYTYDRPATTSGKQDIPATCTSIGYRYSYCSYCGKEKEDIIEQLEHNYITLEKIEPTCENEGLLKQQCSSCNHISQETLKPLGHNYLEIENIPSTCTTSGKIAKKCQKCNNTIEETLPALGHDITDKTTIEPSCQENGSIIGKCQKCGQEIKEDIPALGHDLSNDYTTIKEATIFSKGLISRTCLRCNQVFSEETAKLEIPTLGYIASIGATASLALLIIKKISKKASSKIVEETIQEAVEKELLKPSFEEKTIVTVIDNDGFYKLLKIQKYIKVIESDYKDISQTILEEEPDLSIIDFTKMDLSIEIANLKNLKEQLDNPAIAIFVTKQQIDNNKELLDSLIKQQLIVNYLDIETNYNVAFIKMVLPILKPTINSDESLENVAMIAQALNIDAIVELIDLFITTREIKDTYQDNKEDGLSIVDKATIISDIASICHLDTISSLGGLVSDIDDIKSALTSKIGGNEINTTKDVASGILKVVNELVNDD